MAEPLAHQLLRKVGEACSLYHRLILMVGLAGSGKTHDNRQFCLDLKKTDDFDALIEKRAESLRMKAETRQGKISEAPELTANLRKTNEKEKLRYVA